MIHRAMLAESKLLEGLPMMDRSKTKGKNYMDLQGQLLFWPPRETPKLQHGTPRQGIKWDKRDKPEDGGRKGIRGDG